MKEPKRGAKQRRSNIEPRILRGDKEFFEAYGFDGKKQAEFRTKGMPCLYDGKCFFYFPEKVDLWLENNFSIQSINIKS